MYGQIFQDVVGKPVSAFDNLIEVEKAAEKSLGKALQIQSIESPLVTPHGNIFPYVPGLFVNIDERISLFLKHGK
mgnify:FL=1